MKNQYQLMYKVGQYGPKNEPSIISEVVMIMHNSMVQIGQHSQAEGTENFENVIHDLFGNHAVPVTGESDEGLSSHPESENGDITAETGLMKLEIDLIMNKERTSNGL